MSIKKIMIVAAVIIGMDFGMNFIGAMDPQEPAGKKENVKAGESYTGKSAAFDYVAPAAIEEESLHTKLQAGMRGLKKTIVVPRKTEESFVGPYSPVVYNLKPSESREIIAYGLRSFYWVNKGDDVLIGGMERPQKDTPEALRLVNVGLVINLTGYDFVNKDLYFKQGVEPYDINVRDMSPPTIDQIEEFIKKADKCMSTGKNVIAHCFGGKGRTGTMISCWLIAKKGLSPEEAVKRVRDCKAGSVETASQMEIIQKFHEKVHLSK